MQTKNDESSGSQVTTQENAAAHYTMYGDEKTVSPVLDTDEQQKAALLKSRDELIANICATEEEFRIRSSRALAPLRRALVDTDRLLLVYDRPPCFGWLGRELGTQHGPTRCDGCPHGSDCYREERIRLARKETPEEYMARYLKSSPFPGVKKA
jgi:hypothetical protein